MAYTKEEQKKYDKKRYYANLEENRERVKLYMREKRKREPEKVREITRRCWRKNKDKYNKLQNQRYYKNRDKRLEKQKQYYQEHQKERLAYNKVYIQTPEGKQRRTEARNRRRACKNNIVETYTTIEWKGKLKFSNGICTMCKKNVGIKQLQLDHIYPISKAEIGRIYTINDIQPLCGKCNNRKNNKII